MHTKRLGPGPITHMLTENGLTPMTHRNCTSTHSTEKQIDKYTHKNKRL